MPNVFEMLKQAGQLKKQAGQLQTVLNGKTCSASSRDNKVTLRINGKMELLSIDISPDLLSPEKKTYLEKVILQTWQIAQKEMAKMVQEELKGRMGDLPFGGNLPF